MHAIADDLEILIACHECDLLQRKRCLREGETACCRRCGAFLYQRKRHSLERALALSLASLILFVLANAFPFLSMEVQGRVQTISLPSAVFALYRENQWLLAVCVGLMILLAPLLKILGLLYLLLPLHWGRRPPRSPFTYRIVERMVPWSMMEIYLIGVLVALVKLAEMAEIVLGIAFWSFVALIVTETAAGVMLDKYALWRRLERPA